MPNPFEGHDSPGDESLAPNPFDDENGRYLVLVNGAGQHSLWPASSVVPSGWGVVFGEAGRQECLDHVEESWTALRPTSMLGAEQRH